MFVYQSRQKRDISVQEKNKVNTGARLICKARLYASLALKSMQLDIHIKQEVSYVLGRAFKRIQEHYDEQQQENIL